MVCVCLQTIDQMTRGVSPNPKFGASNPSLYGFPSWTGSLSLQNQNPANDEYENFGRIGDGEYVVVNRGW